MGIGLVCGVVYGFRVGLGFACGNRAALGLVMGV